MYNLKTETMKLYKALKLKKKMAGEIAKLKQQISSKNSYNVGSLNAEKYNIKELETQLTDEIDDLINLKCEINRVNAPIQNLIYRLAELKGLVVLWESVSVIEGEQEPIFGREVKIEYKVQIDERERDQIVKALQERIDNIQEEIDIYNHTTEI